MTSSQRIDSYRLTFAVKQHKLPGLELVTQEGPQACDFLSENACRVYSKRRQARAYIEGIFFKVKQDRCKGYKKTKVQSAGEYRKYKDAKKANEMNDQAIKIELNGAKRGPINALRENLSTFRAAVKAILTTND